MLAGQANELLDIGLVNGDTASQALGINALGDVIVGASSSFTSQTAFRWTSATGVWAKGYVIGLISAFLGEQRFLSAESIEASGLSLLKRDDLLQLMEQIPRFGLNIAKLLALLASDSIKRTIPLALNSTAMRLGKVLSDLAQPQNQEELNCFYIIKGLSQEDLARMVGASRPWVNQTLSSFEDKGLIHRGKGQIIIPDFREFQSAFEC